MKQYFNAPWGRALKWTSLFATLICLGISGSGFFLSPLGGFHPALWISSAAPLFIVAGAALFWVRGYTITPETLLIHRLVWDTPIPLSGLLAVESIPNAMAKSIRTWGNGGMYSFTGWYRCKTLGSYLAYVTDLNRTVVLHDGRHPIIVSPGDPEAFVSAVRSHILNAPP